MIDFASHIKRSWEPRMRSALLFALLCAPIIAAAGTPPAEALPFIEDDYGRAVAEAKKSKLPIFVDAWAPW